MPDLEIVEIVVLCLFVAWCVGVFLFLRMLSKRAKDSAAKPEAGRQQMDELIAKVEKLYSDEDSES